MRFDFDREADALDIVLADGIVARTEEIDSGTLVDVDAQGRALSIEVIQPARPWPLDTVIDQYHLDASVAAILRSLWQGHATYPFAYPAKMTAVATSAMLVPA